MNQATARTKICAALALGTTMLALEPASHACCDWEDRAVWVPGRYTNATAGDVVAPYLDSASILAPILAGLGELGTNYKHVLMVEEPTGTMISHNQVDENQVETGWTCSHPLNPYDLMPMRPGVLDWVPADGSKATSYTRWGYVPSNFNELVPGTVLHKAGGVCTAIPSYGGYLQTGGYELRGFTRNVANGMCTEYMNSSCHVPRPTPAHYSTAQVSTAASNMYNGLFNKCMNEIGWLKATWCGIMGTGQWGECDSVANQVVNTFLYWNSWDTGKESWGLAVTDVVTPTRMVAAFTGTKTAATWVAGYYTTKLVQVCRPGPCP